MIGGNQAGSATLIRMTHREIANDLDKRIRDGEYPPESQLEFGELMALYDVKRGTIKRAVSLLRDRGLVVDSPGRGVFVQVPPA